MDMKSMKLSKNESESLQPVEAKQDAPAYPYGLRLELNDETMKKLGLEKLPEVGSILTLEAKVVVERVSQNDTTDGGKRQDMSLQITDMSLCDCDDEETSTAEKLYKTDGTPASSSSPSGKTILVEL